MFNHFIDEEIESILVSGLSEEQSSKVLNYIMEIYNDLESSETDVEDLEEEVSSLEFELQDKNDATRRVIQEIVEDQWKYVHPTYDTKEKILDRLDKLARYGE